MKVIIVGGTGHLGTALGAHAPAGVTIEARGRSTADRFDLLHPAPLPDCDLVIGAFPLARTLQNHPRAGALAAAWLEACGPARLVQLSTDAVFSGRTGQYDDQDTPDPVTAYGRSQAMVDACIARTRPDALVVRTSFIFGWSDGQLDRRLAPLVDGCAVIEDHRWPNNVFRSPTEVNFLACGIWRAVERQLAGVINIAGPRTSIADFFIQALDGLGITACAHQVTDPQGPHDTSLAGDRMARELDFDQGENWEWFRNFQDRGRRSSVASSISDASTSFIANSDAATRT